MPTSLSKSNSDPAVPVAVIGLGYVGLPLALHFAKVGVPVIGLDTDEVKVRTLRAGESYIAHLEAAEIREVISNRRFQPDTDFSLIRQCQAVLICVPTPLTSDKQPDLSHVLTTGKKLAPYLEKGCLVVLESTTYPGTTDTELRAVLEAGSGMVAGRDFNLAYSPEREDPGNPDSDIARIPKVVGGYTPACLDRALALYAKVVKQTVPVSNCRIAEAVKLTENIFRATNIAMVNELKMVFSAMNIDVWEVLDAAKTKPFGYMPFQPGPGLGGHCIPIDPFYLSWKARQYGQNTRFIELAGEINTQMPAYVIQRCRDALSSKGQSLCNARVLLVGIAYKPEVDDDRESPAYALWNLLESEGARVTYHDPFIPVIRPSRDQAHLAGQTSRDLSPALLAEQNLVVLVTHHRGLNYALLAEASPLLVDTRNALATYQIPADRYFKA
jgi:UDP-N-acetyl-D-glucosamine dehydrogenase